MRVFRYLRFGPHLIEVGVLVGREDLLPQLMHRGQVIDLTHTETHTEVRIRDANLSLPPQDRSVGMSTQASPS